MTKTTTAQTGTPLTTAEVRNLQVIENNPFTADDEALHAMFDRLGWTPEQCADYFKAHHGEMVPELAAE